MNSVREIEEGSAVPEGAESLTPLYEDRPKDGH